MTRKVKTVSFSRTSEYDAKLLAYAEQAERGAFSQYVKRLIYDDMRKVAPMAEVAPVPEVEVEDVSGFL